MPARRVARTIRWAKKQKDNFQQLQGITDYLLLYNFANAHHDSTFSEKNWRGCPLQDAQTLKCPVTNSAKPNVLLIPRQR